MDRWRSDSFHNHKVILTLASLLIAMLLIASLGLIYFLKNQDSPDSNQKESEKKSDEKIPKRDTEIEDDINALSPNTSFGL